MNSDGTLLRSINASADTKYAMSNSVLQEQRIAAAHQAEMEKTHPDQLLLVDTPCLLHCDLAASHSIRLPELSPELACQCRNGDFTYLSPCLFSFLLSHQHLYFMSCLVADNPEI